MCEKKHQGEQKLTMENRNPLLSVCIPVFNCEKFIGQTIRSVLQQSFEDFELLIIDNASTDRTYEIIKGFSDARIRCIRNEHNLGMMGNWNKCLDEARGDYLKLLPADDLIYETCLEEQVGVFQHNPKVALVCCSRDIIDIAGKKLIRRSFAGVEGQISGSKAVKKIVRSGTNRLGEPGAILFKRSLISAENHFSDQYPYVIDLGLWIKLLSLGDLYVIQKPLCAFRVSPQSESVNSRHFHRDDFSRYIRSLDKQLYQLGAFDIFWGVCKSSLLEIMRRFFYKLTRVYKLFRK